MQNSGRGGDEGRELYSEWVHIVNSHLQDRVFRITRLLICIIAG